MTIMELKQETWILTSLQPTIDITKIMKAEPRRVGGINVALSFSPEHLQTDDKQRKILEMPR